jgi:hypothetical protein
MSDNAEKKPAAAEYDGTGLPPIGTECEFRIGGGLAEWHLCTVRYILNGDEDPDADGWRAVVWCPHLDKDQLAHLPRFQFRPIRSQAERDREEIINAAAKVVEVKFGSPRSVCIAYCEALYDAGRLRNAEKP